MSVTRTIRRAFTAGIAMSLLATTAWAQMEKPTARAADEGDGPYDRLILRGVTVIDGTGAPPMGPVDIVIEGDRIQSIRTVGYPGLDINENRRPDLEIEDNPDASTHEIDLAGHFVMPGFVDMHAHTGGSVFFIFSHFRRTGPNHFTEHFKILLPVRQKNFELKLRPSAQGVIRLNKEAAFSHVVQIAVDERRKGLVGDFILLFYPVIFPFVLRFP